MTYCADQTKLLARAGRDVATKLLPEPFSIWHEDHSTGIQMTIVTKAQPAQIVWRGSIWHSSIYEFNDHGHIPGLQPEFEFAREAIDKYFRDLRDAVEKRAAEYKAIQDAREQEAKAKKQSAIEATRKAVNAP